MVVLILILKVKQLRKPLVSLICLNHYNRKNPMQIKHQNGHNKTKIVHPILVMKDPTKNSMEILKKETR